MAISTTMPALLSKLHPLRLTPRRRQPRSPSLLALLIVLSGTFTMLLLYMMILGLAPFLAPHLVNATANDYKGYKSRCSFDLDVSYFPDWMDYLPDMLNISSLSIPGTHDTMTYKIGDVSLQCQLFDLKLQLHAGIRYIDIRARMKNNKLEIYHADEPTGFSFEYVLLTVFDYLQLWPNEFIFMRLKEEGEPIGHNNMTFQEAFDDMRWNWPLLKERAKRHFYIYNNTVPLPTIGEVRSKIIFFQDFPSIPPYQYGIEWAGPQMVLQDEWIVQDVEHLNDKYKAIEAHFDVANFTPLNNKYMYLSHLSASGGVLPIQAAAGPMNHSVVGMNDRTANFMEWRQYDQDSMRLGIVIMDFPGQVMTYDILRWTRKVYNDSPVGDHW